MQLLVIGQRGQLARSLVERAPPGWSVETAGRERIDLDRPDNAAAALAAMVNERRIDGIVNAAAYTAVDAAEDEEAAAMRVNAEAAGRIARIAADARIPFLHVSTDYVFSGDSDRPYVEDAPVSPAGAYGRSKAAGERAVLDAGGPSAIVRTAWLFSPYGRNFVATMLRLARERDEIGVVDDQVGNPTSALDLADALFAMIAAWPPSSGAQRYHFAGSGCASWFDLASATMREAASRGMPAARVRPIATADYPTRAPRPANSQLSTCAIAQAFGIVPRRWEAMLGDVMDRIAGADNGAAAAR